MTSGVARGPSTAAGWHRRQDHVHRPAQWAGSGESQISRLRRPHPTGDHRRRQPIASGDLRLSRPSAAKSSKACLSGMFRMAIEDGAVTANPVRDSSTRISVGKKSPRALTPEETSTLTAWWRANERAVAVDVPDLVDRMLATGCRIGEALALRHGPNADGRPLLDLEANTWEVNATVVPVPGRGLVVQPRPRTAAGWRVVAVLGFAASMVRRRVSGSDGVGSSPSHWPGQCATHRTRRPISGDCSTPSTVSRAPAPASCLNLTAHSRPGRAANAFAVIKDHGHG